MLPRSALGALATGLPLPGMWGIGGVRAFVVSGRCITRAGGVGT